MSDDLSRLSAPTFTTGEAVAAGLRPRQIYKLRETGQIVELSRGVFRRADAHPTPYLDLLAVAHRVPAGVICLLSAATLHGLTDHVPPAVQVAVPRPQRPPRIAYPPVEVSQFDGDTFSLGVSAFPAAPGETVRLYDAPRTVADLMRFRHRLGEANALRVLRSYLTSPGADPATLLVYARALDVEGPTRRAMEAVLS